jgi:hypothetical protein
MCSHAMRAAAGPLVLALQRGGAALSEPLRREYRTPTTMLLQSMCHTNAEDEVLDGHLRQRLFGRLRDRCLQVVEVCRQNLREEEAMAQFLDSNIEQVTRTISPKRGVVTRASPA